MSKFKKKLRMGIFSEPAHVKELLPEIHKLGFNPQIIFPGTDAISAGFDLLVIRPTGLKSPDTTVGFRFKKTQDQLKKDGKPFVPVLVEDGSAHIIQAAQNFTKTGNFEVPVSSSTPAVPAAPVTSAAPATPAVPVYKTGKEAVQGMITHFGYFTIAMLRYFSDEALVKWFEDNSSYPITPQALSVSRAVRQSHSEGSLRLAARELVRENAYPHFPLFKSDGRNYYDVLCLTAQRASDSSFKQLLANRTKTSLSPVSSGNPATANLVTQEPEPVEIPMTVSASPSPVSASPSPVSAPVSVPSDPEGNLKAVMELLATELKASGKTSYESSGVKVELITVHFVFPGNIASLCMTPRDKAILTSKLADVTCPDCKKHDQFKLAELLVQNNT